MRVLEVLLVNLAGLWQGLRQDFNLLEVASIVVAFVAWKKGWRPKWKPVPRFRRPWIAAVALALGTVVVRLALLPVLKEAPPVVTDEFSHLLLADTLLHGRVANPQHPFWEHFESLHILVRPVYVSDYFPGHAAMLAAGRAIVSSAWAAVLAECALFLVALFWMLRGWMPARWALFGVLLAALRFGIASYWVNAFHGGFLAAIGGALVLGATGRLCGAGIPACWRLSSRRGPVGASSPSAGRKPSGRQECLPHTWALGFALGGGLAVLMISRPFEGAFFAVPPVLAIVWQLRTHVAVLARTAIVAGLMVALAGVGLGAYFKQVTGSPFKTAYQINQKEYGWPMALAWQTPAKVEHRHVELANYYKYELGEREKVAGPVNFIEYLTFRMQEYWRFFLGPVLSVPLIMIGRVWRRSKIVLAALGGGALAISLEGAASPHYLAPAAAAFIAIVVECSRHMFAARVGIPRLLPVALASVLVLRIAAQNLGLPHTQELNYQSWCCEVEGNYDKARIVAKLTQTPGGHLVLVRAKTDEYNLLQWIYNEADIDASRIVWARDLGAEKNAALIEYFGGRHVWMVDPNHHPATLERLTGGGDVFAERNSSASSGR